MLPDDSWTVARRVDPELKTQWGLYSVRHDRWLEMVFSSERKRYRAFMCWRWRARGLSG